MPPGETHIIGDTVVDKCLKAAKPDRRRKVIFRSADPF